MNKIDWQKKGAGHRQRLRDKFLDRGIEAFTDAEILELLLTLGTPRRDCKEMARATLDRFGSLAAAMDASTAELAQIKGLGEKNTFAIHFIQAVSRRYLKERLAGKNYLRSSREVGDYLIHAMRSLKREVFMVIFLDASFGIITAEILAEGSLTSNTIHPRELIKKALEHHAAALVIAHNHPSGTLSPSNEDRLLTRHLCIALSFADIKLVDHIIVGDGENPYSFADHGIMDELRRECRQIVSGT